MSLERRIREALHAADDYQPSADLFSRLRRSIEEDRAHRRRLLFTAGASTAGLMAIGLFIAATSQRDAAGAVTVPKWSLQVVIAVVLITILATLGPALRRLGGPLLDEVFHLSPTTGTHFSRLLDIAYYLFFGGLTVTNLDPTDWQAAVGIPSQELWVGVTQIAGFLLGLGVAHVANLAVLPTIGLLFTSLSRRAARRDAGSSAPPESTRAKQADRLASGIVLTAAMLGIVGALSLIGLIVFTLGTSG